MDGLPYRSISEMMTEIVDYQPLSWTPTIHRCIVRWRNWNWNIFQGQYPYFTNFYSLYPNIN